MKMGASQIFVAVGLSAAWAAHLPDGAGEGLLPLPLTTMNGTQAAAPSLDDIDLDALPHEVSSA